MCLIVFALQQHPDYPLIVAANRDEFHRRPTAEAAIWQIEDDAPRLLSGRDLQAGGTWMGVSEQGSFAAVTNIRNGEVNPERPRSRGQLVLDGLMTQSHRDFAGQVLQQADEYNGFNLLTGTPESLFYLSNAHTYPNLKVAPSGVRKLEAGVYGLSNGLLDTPWPKLQRSKNELTEAIHKLHGDLPSLEDALFAIMANTAQAPDPQLPNTGVPLEKERMLSAGFIRSEEYGTRASTLLFMHRSGESTLIERSFGSRANPSQPDAEVRLTLCSK